MLRLWLVCLFIVSLMGISVLGQTKPIAQPTNPPIRFDHEITIEDDSTGSFLVVDPNSGEYKFYRCSDGAYLSGFGKVKVNGCAISFEDASRDHRVLASINECTQEAKSAVEVFGGLVNQKPLKEFLSDKDMRDNTLSCTPNQKTQD